MASRKYKRSTKRSKRSTRKRSKRKRSKRRSTKRSKRSNLPRATATKSLRTSKKYGLLAYYNNKTSLSATNNIKIIRQQSGTDNNGGEWYVDAYIESSVPISVIKNWLSSKGGFKKIQTFHVVEK